MQVAVLTGYAVSGGGFNNYLGGPRSRAFIAGGDEQLRLLRPAWKPWAPGIRYRRVPTCDYWRRQLKKAERLILDVLVNAYPSALNKAEFAAQTGYEANGGGFNNPHCSLRTFELIERAIPGNDRGLLAARRAA